MARKLAVIKPKQFNNPEMRSGLYAAVDCVANAKSPVIGYAFVSFHANGGFRSYWSMGKTNINVVDMPDAVRARLQATMILTLEDNK